ncbi:MAG TPA: electron transfer flavoprotein subunit alpha/FixB family protein [Acidobacteriaceae bacterium]|nr:electron transfer flavoprotein subunit alpha/FixB family protein [Acidobacteriaceae bacterium]
MATHQNGGSGGVLLFSENPETVGELLTLGRELASRLHRPLIVAAVGRNAQALLDEGLARGADEVLAVRDSQGDGIVPDESIATALCEAIRASAPAVVLVGATRTGAELAARTAQMLQIPCASSCVALEMDDAGNLSVDRRVYGGRFVSRQLLNIAPRMVTVPPKRFPRAEKVSELHGSIQELQVELPAPRIKTMSVNPRSHSQVDISKAEVIISAGRGVKKMEDLQLLEKLAKLLGGVLAGSRPLTGDVDWLPVDRRIGLSGQTVKPNLYIACGISGQIEHIVGMKGARTVVAINNDAKAPIHGEADYSVIGDLYEVVPALIQACEKAMGKVG